MKNLTDFFVNSVKRFPRHNALFVEGDILTYQELYEKSSRLADMYSQKAGQHYALISARGIDSYVALLAILMAGKIYIPFSIKNPLERNQQMLVFSRANEIIIDPKSGQIIEDYCLSTKNNSANQNAYLLFTSGSTGQPKAVMTTHRAAIEYIEKMLAYYQPNEWDRFSQLTDLSFDVAIQELFMCWASGACLYVISDNHFSKLHRIIPEYKLTVWTSVPSVLSFLNQTNRLLPGAFPTIRYSLILGEAFTEALANHWHLAAPHSQIDNLYGPTEATIIFTRHRWQQGLAHSSGYVPIGKPLAGQEILILDSARNPVAKNQVGELYLAGSQVADGYWNNPLLTKEKFIHHQQKIWYKTGDFVSWDDAVGLVFKGRDIDQLKVRGGRVERLEVEMVLRQAAKTNTVAIVPFQTSTDGVVLNLMAFIGNSPVHDSGILQFARRQLPDYMIPSKIIRVNALPCNKNGKVDYPLLTLIAKKGISNHVVD